MLIYFKIYYKNVQIKFLIFILSIKYKRSNKIKLNNENHKTKRKFKYIRSIKS